ncbi:MAG: ABC transporter permease [Bacteroidota bacterium]
MLQNHIKIAWRNLWKNKVYTLINILGLTIGITVALLLYRMVSYELSFNKSFEEYDRIVRVYSEDTEADGDLDYTPGLPIPAMDILQSTVPQFEASSKVNESWSILTVPDPMGAAPLKKFQVTNGQTALFVEDGFFEIFNVEWTDGSIVDFDAPDMIALSENWATKAFGSAEAAINQIVLIDNLIPTKVVAVFEDLPNNIDFNFPYLVSYSTLEKHADIFGYDNEWGSTSSSDQFYALLKSADQLEAASAIVTNVGAEQYTDNGRRERVHQVQPLSDLHHSEDVQNSGNHRTSISELRTLGFVGLLILIIGCFNFINLATAQSALRAQEVGVRKVLGSNTQQLITQFMSETVIIVGIAMVLGAVTAQIALPFLNEVSEVPSELPFLTDPSILSILLMIGVAVTFLAGLYPSTILANFKPKRALSKHPSQNESSGGETIRKSIVVSQFVIAQVLIIGALLTVLQLNHVQDQDLGFDEELVYNFYFNSDSATVARQGALKQALLQIPAIESVSFSSDPPISRSTWASNFRYASRPEDEPYSITMKFVDENYQETYGIELVAGRWLSVSDTARQAVVNMTTLKKLGIDDPEAIIGQTITKGSTLKLPIVGVTNDFQMYSAHDENLPLMFSTMKDYYGVAGVKMRPDNISATLAAMGAAFDKVLPEQIFDGDFMDDDVADFYQDEERQALIYQTFGLIAILISCLGLFGLLTHATHQRVKEIGIRKVLGASVGSIIALLSKDFIRLVVIAFVIATPIAWYFMNQWLQDFVYRIELRWWMFALAGVGAIVIALVTVSFQTVKAALVNPVESLKSE